MEFNGNANIYHSLVLNSDTWEMYKWIKIRIEVSVQRQLWQVPAQNEIEFQKMRQQHHKQGLNKGRFGFPWVFFSSGHFMLKEMS